MSLIEIKAEIPARAADGAEEVLLEAGAANWMVAEDAVARRAWLVGIFPSEKEARVGWTHLRGLIGSMAQADPVVRPLSECDWRDSYKAHFKAWRFGRLHWVPVWERETFRLPAGHAVLWLDPGLAFGTGNHETTRLCIERLVAFEARAGRAGRIVYAGCGSGILALSAAVLGFRDVEGFDSDLEAVRVSRGNAALNGLEGRVRFFLAGLAEGLAGRRADLLLANIQSDVLARFARPLAGAVAPGGTLALGGILASERDSVIAAFRAIEPGWTCDSRRLGEWCDVQWISSP